MSDPIDDMVEESATTQSFADKIAAGAVSVFNKIKAALSRPSREISIEEPTPEGTEGINENLSVSTRTSASSPAGVVPHVEHPYCLSTPRNPFVKDMALLVSKEQVIWRKSASVIVAARNNSPSSSSSSSSFDYNVCLLKRSMNTRYMPGAIVFPGGLAEDSDKYHPDEPDSYMYERCAARELKEESGISLPRGPSSLIHLCDWKTPDFIARKNMPKGGYETRFFVTLLETLPTQGVGPDGEEISNMFWTTPDQGLREALPFPQQHLLNQLSKCRHFAQLEKFARQLKKGIYRYQLKPVAFFGPKNGYYMPGDCMHDRFRPINGELWQHRAYVESLNEMAEFIVSEELVKAAETSATTDQEWCITVSSENSKL